MTITAEWILKAVEAVRSGLAQKLENNGVIVYACGTIVRIDIKNSVKLEKVEEEQDTDDSPILVSADEADEDLPWY